jgi:hypothetical protein
MLSLLRVQMNETLNTSGFTFKTSDDEVVSRVKDLAVQFDGRQSPYEFQNYTWHFSRQFSAIHLLLNCFKDCGWVMLDNTVAFESEMEQIFVYTFRK